MKEMTFISLIIYAHNDEKRIADLIIKMDSFLNNNFNSYEIIIVNDDSRDNTEKEIFKIKDDVNGNVTVVNLLERHGVDRALFAGTDISIGDFIFEQESVAIEYPMELILEMYKKSSLEGYDILFSKSDSTENLFNRTYFNIVKGLSSHKIRLEDSHLRLVTRRALYSMAGNKEIITNRNIMYKNCGFEWNEIVFDSTPIPRANKKKASRRISQDLKAMLIYTKLFSRLPFLLSGLFLIFTFSILLSGIFNSSFLILDDISNRLVLSSICFGFALIFLILGIMYKSINILISIEMNSNPYKVKSIKRINRY